MKQERYDSAEGYLLQVLRLSRELRRRNIEADTRDSLGLLSSKRGDGERATGYHRKHYRSAYRLWTKLGSPRAAEIAQALAAREP